MQILRTHGTSYQGWGGYLNCMIYPYYTFVLEFRYMPKTSTKYLRYVSGYQINISATQRKMPIGMSADTCIQYWNDL